MSNVTCRATDFWEEDSQGLGVHPGIVSTLATAPAKDLDDIILKVTVLLRQLIAPEAAGAIELAVGVLTDLTRLKAELTWEPPRPGWPRRAADEAAS